MIGLLASLPTASALASGWYLLGPPTEADLDTSCRADGWPAWQDYLRSLRYGEAPATAQALRCLRESLINISSGRLSEWVTIEIPNADGVAGDYVGAFATLKDCQTAEYVARVAPDVTRRPSTTGLWQTLPKGDWFDSYANDRAFKELDRNGKGKPVDSGEDAENALRRALKRFEGEHPDDDKAITFAAVMRATLSEGKASQGESLCIATDDPRLNRN
jgi:hypothetical protein